MYCAKGRKWRFKNNLYRDFTYIDDIVEGIESLLLNLQSEAEEVPHRIFNIGNSNLEKAVGFKPIKSIREVLQKLVDWYRDYYKMV